VILLAGWLWNLPGRPVLGGIRLRPEPADGQVCRVTEVTAQDIAEAFGFIPPIGCLEPMPARSFVQTWCLDTGSGGMLIKRFWPDDELPWRDRFELAMDVQQRAVVAGVDTPAPVTPARPVFGTVARIDGHGLFRAFPYIQHRRLGDADDIAEWLGMTLARIHQLRPMSTRPAPNWWYGQDPPVPPEQWLAWRDEGERAGKSWVCALREHLELVLEQSSRVAETFNGSPPYVVSHLDVEPQNVLVTDSAPVLIDWDSAGPESVPLETAYVFFAFARRGRESPDIDAIRRSHAAYVAAGGMPLVVRAGVLDRVIGRHLATITTALVGYFAGGHSDEQIRARLERLPSVVAETRSAERLLAAALPG
jgi:hypothetical protein